MTVPGHNLTHRLLTVMIIAVIGLFVGMSASADLRTAPTWFDPDGVALGDDWHYRVPINIPVSAAVSSTIDLDVDFALLLTDLGVSPGSVDFDERSPRIVRPNGALANEQEFTDERFNDVLDTTNNARGEIKFILEDAPGSGPYYLYFDITENGVKPVNPQQVINGNFENSNGAIATRWGTNTVNTGGAENNEVVTSAAGATINIAAGCNSNGANNVDNGPNDSPGTATGRDWYLIGFRDNCEDGGGGIEQVQMTRTIQNPAGAARGDLTFFFQIQSFDGLNAAGANYDYLRVQVNGAILDHTTLGINNATAPALRIRDIGISRAGYGATLVSHGWKQATIDMTQFPAGATNIVIETRHSDADDGYRFWSKIDDVEWAVQSGSLGAVEGYGINITSPNDSGTASTYVPGQVIPITVIEDAHSETIAANIVDQNGVTVASNVVLFDDGSHGDASANDGIWNNDGSDPTFPTYTILGTDPTGTNWQIIAFGNDASTSSLGVADGLLNINGQPTNPIVQANYWNVDQQVFTVAAPELNFAKLSMVVSDPFNGTSNPKRIPGAVIEYLFNVSNSGSASVGNDSLVLTDPLPSNIAICVTSSCSGAASPVIFDDSGSPVPTGLSFNGGDVSYSIDGSDFSYTPIPDVDGFDQAITHARFNPKGVFASGGASFTLRWFVRVE